MPTDAKAIVARICDYAAQIHFPVGAVRIQKLVYLLEWEYYRWERTRLTDLDWVFFHYGPWSRTLSSVVEQNFHIDPEILPDGRQFKQITHTPSDYFPQAVKFDPGFEGMVQRILETWTTALLPELLDFVYFHTEPMQGVERGQALDFTKIPSAREVGFPINPYSLLSRKTKADLRQALQNWSQVAERPKASRVPVDDTLAEAIEAIDAEDQTPPLTGDTVIPDEIAKRLRESSRE